MFTIKADALSAILDKVAPHRPCDLESDPPPFIQLDCSPRWLHAIAGGERTLAVARTPVDGAHWTAPIDFDDAAALRSWLAFSSHVLVEHTLDDGRPLLHFREGAAKLTLPVVSYGPDIPWRAMLLRAARDRRREPGPVQLDSADLALWQHAGEHIEVRHAGGRAPFLITAGKDFIGLHQPQRADGPSHDQDSLAGWTDSVRSRRFIYAGQVYEVGARYADRWGAVWQVVARPEPGEEPMVVLADRSAVALPLGVVLRVGGRLARQPH
ncbi:hypothetical protein [Streptomyces sp. NPDC058989]|uniref:hypothetical protein n=1 Tax=Streptomyces sp. NPDC058989 TaxID=3346686 RepID=UPI0036C1C8C5